MCLSYIYIYICCFFSAAGAVIFGCTVALCFLIRDLMFYVIGESVSCVLYVEGLLYHITLCEFVS